jgi:hypothetical protein
MNSFRKGTRAAIQGLLAVACLSSAVAVQAQVPKSKPVVTPPHAEDAERSGAVQPEPNDPAHQGVKVHGHWAIDVKNPDGAVAKHVEFENSLVVGGNGDNLLAYALTGYLSAADWALSLNNANSSETALCGQVCYGVNSSNSLMGQMFCSGSSSSRCTTGTSVKPILAGLGGGFATIKITGNITPASSGNITSVQTLMGGCTTPPLYVGDISISNMSPQVCQNSTLSSLPSGTFFYGPFTSTSSFTPIPVVAGQIVSITVTISFS